MALCDVPGAHFFDVSLILLQSPQVSRQSFLTIMLSLCADGVIADYHLAVAALHDAIAIKHFVSADEHSADVLAAVRAVDTNEDTG